MPSSVMQAIADYYSEDKGTESQHLVDRAIASYTRQEMVLDELCESIFDVEI